MDRADPFEYTDAPSWGSDAFVVRVPQGLTDAAALMRALYEEARLPGYFGFNWDALSDCLRDLHWVEGREVVLVHGDVPRLSPGELQTYAEVLGESIASWTPGDAHTLRVVFPSAAKLLVPRPL